MWIIKIMRGAEQRSWSFNQSSILEAVAYPRNMHKGILCIVVLWLLVSSYWIQEVNYPKSLRLIQRHTGAWLQKPFRIKIVSWFINVIFDWIKQVNQTMGSQDKIPANEYNFKWNLMSVWKALFSIHPPLAKQNELATTYLQRTPLCDWQPIRGSIILNTLWQSGWLSADISAIHFLKFVFIIDWTFLPSIIAC